ncbi:MAG: hypothetical protein ACJAUP_003893 [Cellvibrionaceae bacterium]|jgi:hypothetical protein
MHLIIYTSEYIARIGDIDKVLSDIVRASKKSNPELGITGLLFYHGNRFVQVIEGEKGALEGLMLILENDTRHRNIDRIVDVEIDKKRFSDWSMDSFNLSEEDKIDPVELKKIRDAYQKIVKVDAETIVDIFKLMIGSKNV